MIRWAFLLLLSLVGTGCNHADVMETAEAYYPELSNEALVARTIEMARVMPFYVTGTCLALLLMLLAVLNGLEHARSLGKGEGIRFGAYVLLLCFVSLFLAMSAQQSWLPAGYPTLAFGLTAVVSALTTALAARARPERAVLAVGYLAVTLTLPMLGILLNRSVYLMDTTASIFIGFAAGLLVTIVVSDPVRGGLVDFMRTREK